MTTDGAEAVLSAKLAALQAHVAESCRGIEKIAVIEIVRTLDFIATLALLGSPLSKEQIAGDYFAQCGTAAALEPFLETSETCPGGVPWQRSPPRLSSYFYSYLVECGKLVDLARLARLERYGLAATKSSTGRVDIHVRSDVHERRERERSWSIRKPGTGDISRPVPKALLQRMLNYVDIDDSYFIRYDNDRGIIDKYIDRAKRYAHGFSESEALPDEYVIGGRRFSEWKQCCERALGRILCHIDFALLLCQKHPSTPLRDVLTIFSRKEDAAAVWVEAGLTPNAVGPTMRALTLRSEDLGGWLQAFELPTSFYVGLGKDFVLLPIFGALANPYFSLFRHLRSVYRSDWDRGMEYREGMFRSDLANLFPAPKFTVPSHGFKIKRNDGSHITDIDAVICDRETGSLALVQLKWYDIYGRSLSERESRRKNLTRAREWVDRVKHWIDGRQSAEIAQTFGLNIIDSKCVPKLYVLARYSAQFDGDTRKDGSACWLSWSQLVALKSQCKGSNQLSEISELAQYADSGPDVVENYTNVHEFPDLVVSVHVGK